MFGNTIDTQTGVATFLAASPSTPSAPGVAGFWGLVSFDTTAPSDVITSDTLNKHTGSFTVTGTSEADSTINIYDGSTLLEPSVPDNSGQWSFTADTLSSVIVHSFTSTATDGSGNVGQSTGAAMYGTSGNDIITSTSGDDILTGGGGANTFVFSGAIFGKDVVTDFKATGSNHDILRFDHGIFASAAEARWLEFT